jgi:hypothetical protein
MDLNVLKSALAQVVSRRNRPRTVEKGFHIYTRMYIYIWRKREREVPNLDTPSTYNNGVLPQTFRTLTICLGVC